VSRKSIKSDLARLDRMNDSDIDYSDIPPLGDEFFKKATAAWPPVKQQVTIRLDADLLNWLKANGKGYQTRTPTASCGQPWKASLRAARGRQHHRRQRRTPEHAAHYGQPDVS
jgi:uncharacterized protein (DUF4415 family)